MNRFVRTLCVSAAALCGSLWQPAAANDFSCAAIPQAEGPPRKLALLVGIDTYQHLSALDGAVNDVGLMSRLLREEFGFDPEKGPGTLALRNKEAGRDAILREIDRHLIAQATRDSVVVFHFSGHGSQVPDVNDDEDGDDPWDEVLVPYDSDHSVHANRDIIDDELGQRLACLFARTTNVTVILDSCNSGTALRGARAVRSVPRDERSATNAGLSSQTTGASDISGGRWVVVAAADANEPAHELAVRPCPQSDADECAHGVLTWHLYGAIRRAGPGATWQQVLEMIWLPTQLRTPPQRTHLEGPGADTLVFGTASRASSRSVPIVAVTDQEIRIGAGRAHGVTVRSLFDVFTPGSRFQDAEPVARLEVTRTEAGLSATKLLNGGPVSLQHVAVETLRFVETPVLRVAIAENPTTEALTEVRSRLAPFPQVALVPADGEFDLEVKHVRHPSDTLRVALPSGELRAPPIENSPRAAGDVARVVLRWARWFNLRTLTNPTSALDLDFRVRDQRGQELPSSEIIEIPVGKSIQIVVGRRDEPLWVAIVELKPDGAVEVIYPPDGSAEVHQSDWIRIHRWNEPTTSMLLLLGSATKLDYAQLTQAPLAERPGQRIVVGGRAPNALADLLSSAVSGSQRSGFEEMNLDDWLTRRVQVRVVPRREE